MPQSHCAESMPERGRLDQPVQINFIYAYAHWKRVVIVFVVQLMPQSHCAESTAERGQM